MEAFGSKRIMFGSDWPVCTLAADYGEVKKIMEMYLGSFSENEKANIMGGNAIRFYQLAIEEGNNESYSD
jgi:L-fuconolactonase